MSTTAALVEGHHLLAMSSMGERWARCQCGTALDWNDYDRAHALHLIETARAEERERIARNIQAAADAAWTGTPRNAYLDAVRIAREGA